VISFEVLGEVTAQEDAWVARLSTQQQHLLAALVLGGGAPVTRGRLEEILWDFRAPYPEKGIARVAHELRVILQEAAPGADLVPSSHGGYRLLMTPEQADVVRFRASAAEARRASGLASAQFMRQALREWGSTAAGLHGGNPLEGLPGQWADSTRHLLRTQYRDAVIHCLAYGISCHDYGPVLAECEQRAADSAPVLLDEEFVGCWILAAAHAGDLARARTIYRRAQDAAEYAGEHLGSSLHQLGARLRDSGTALAASVASPQPIPVITNQRPAMELVAGEDGKGLSATGRLSDGQPGIQGGNFTVGTTGDCKHTKPGETADTADEHHDSPDSEPTGTHQESPRTGDGQAQVSNVFNGPVNAAGAVFGLQVTYGARP
jgi:DNA-binding SARP family transcriptional activator